MAYTCGKESRKHFSDLVVQETATNRLLSDRFFSQELHAKLLIY
jgi:hypothetical protein